MISWMDKHPSICVLVSPVLTLGVLLLVMKGVLADLDSWINLGVAVGTFAMAIMSFWQIRRAVREEERRATPRVTVDVALSAGSEADFSCADIVFNLFNYGDTRVFRLKAEMFVETQSGEEKLTTNEHDVVCAAIDPDDCFTKEVYLGAAHKERLRAFVESGRVIVKYSFQYQGKGYPGQKTFNLTEQINAAKARAAAAEAPTVSETENNS